MLESLAALHICDTNPAEFVACLFEDVGDACRSVNVRATGRVRDGHFDGCPRVVTLRTPEAEAAAGDVFGHHDFIAKPGLANAGH